MKNDTLTESDLDFYAFPRNVYGGDRHSDPEFVVS